MGSKWKLWCWYMKSAAQNWKTLGFILLFSIALNLLISSTSGGIDFWTFLEIPLLAVLFIAIGGIVYVAVNGSYMKIYMEKGFCHEMCEAFEERFIRGKNPSVQQRLTYAEIHIRMGDPERGIFLLNQLKVPESDVISRASYISLYISAALEINDLPLALDVWHRNSAFIDKLFRSNMPEISASLLRIKQISLYALSGKYAEALEVIGNCYSSIQKIPGANADFLNWQIYIYHMTGSRENEEKAIGYAEETLSRIKFDYESVRRVAYADLEKARNGQPPI